MRVFRDGAWHLIGLLEQWRGEGRVRLELRGGRELVVPVGPDGRPRRPDLLRELRDGFPLTSGPDPSKVT